MGLIFDIHAARLYESWYQSSKGRTMDKWAEGAVLSMLDPKPGERILDIGCGAGNHLLFFNKLGLDLTGIDASPYMISRARARLGNRCSLKIGRAEDLPFEDNEFDLTILINTLEFVDSPLNVLQEAARVTRRKVFIGVMNSFSWYGLSMKTQAIFRKSLFRYVRIYSLWELKSYVRRALGDVPMTWHCAQILPAFLGKMGGGDHWKLKHCPFGAFLGISADIIYRMRTEQHPLKLRLKKPHQSMVNGVTSVKTRQIREVHDNEGSLSL
ncbi:MAG: class I SAM-dependent methyltransferase [Deltaproteobacteria bacterium]|nr:class I SAM-dependent methyltransferase [Deltaproteobacteria bacterium]